MTTTDNPLMAGTGLTRFDAVAAADVEPAIRRLLEQADAALSQAVSDAVPARYEAVSAVLDVATEALGRAWGAVSHLNAVRDTPELRAAYNALLPAVTDFHTRMGADERLYAKYKAIAATTQPAELDEAQQAALSHALRDFVLSGAELQV